MEAPIDLQLAHYKQLYWKEHMTLLKLIKLLDIPQSTIDEIHNTNPIFTKIFSKLEETQTQLDIINTQLESHFLFQDLGFEP